MKYYYNFREAAEAEAAADTTAAVAAAAAEAKRAFTLDQVAVEVADRPTSSPAR